jgi:hypothetical protein
VAGATALQSASREMKRDPPKEQPARHLARAVLRSDETGTREDEGGTCSHETKTSSRERKNESRGRSRASAPLREGVSADHADMRRWELDRLSVAKPPKNPTYGFTRGKTVRDIDV